MIELKENMMKYSLMVLLTIMVLVSSAFPETGDGGYAGAFLRMGMGARPKALGDSYTAIPEGALAGFYNPALLPHLKSRRFTASHAFLTLDRTLDYIGYAQALQPPDINGKKNPLKAGFSLAWVHAGVDNIYGTDGSGNHTQDYSNAEHAFYLSFAVSPNKAFSIGVSGKVLYSRMPGLEKDNGALTSTGFGMDFGAYFSPIQNLTFGLVLRDNMSKYTWNTDTVYERGTSTVNDFPKVKRAAVAYRIPQDWLLVTAEVEDSDLQNPRYHFGTELSWPDLGALRFGLDDSSPTFGLGLQFNVLNHLTYIDYAFAPNDYQIGTDHIFTWSLDF